MGILDDVFDKAKNVANMAGKKTEEFVEVSKLKLEENQLKGDLEKAFAKLGHIMYELLKSDSENQKLVGACVEEIDEIAARLNTIENRVAEAKKQVKCPVCGINNQVEAYYCHRCGSRLVKNDEEPAAEAQADDASDDAFTKD